MNIKLFSLLAIVSALALGCGDKDGDDSAAADDSSSSDSM